MHKRIKDDAYYTPEWCYESILNFIDWHNITSALEPALGDARIFKFLQKQIPNSFFVPSSIDFLKSFYKDFDLVFTNPPYNQAKEFVEHSLSFAKTVIMLLRLDFLASKDRYPLFKNHQLTGLYVLSKRPSFAFGGTDRYDYGWFVWDKVNVTRKGIHHILPNAT